MATFVKKKMHLYKSHWVFFCHHGMKIWKKEKKKKKKKKKKIMILCYPMDFFNEIFHQNVKKKKKVIFCYNILKTMPKFENFWRYLGSSFRLIAV